MRIVPARIVGWLAALLVLVAPAFQAAAQDKPSIEVVPQIGHSSSVWSVAFSPDGRQLLSGSLDNTVKLWDGASGALLRTFEGHSDYVGSVAFSPGGRQVLSGSYDGTLKLWDAASGALLRTFTGQDPVESVVFSPGGQQLVSGGRDGVLKLWDTPSGALLRTFEGGSLTISSVAFSPDGRQVLSGDQDKTLKLWDTASGALLRTFEGGSLTISSVAFSPDGRQVLSGGEDKTLKLWDAASGALLRTFKGHSDTVLSVAFSPDGRQVLSGSWDKTLKLWNTASGALLRTFTGHSGSVKSVTFSPDGRQVLSGSSDSTLKLWDAAGGGPLRTFARPSDAVQSIAFSPGGQQLVSGGQDGTLKLWDAASGALLRTFEAHSSQVRSVAFSPDGRQVLSGSWDMTLKLWDAAGGALLRTFKGHSKWVNSVAFSPGGRQVLSGSLDNTVKLWDAGSGALLRTFEGHSYQVTSVAFSPDGRQVLSGSQDKTLKLWDAASGALLRTFEGHSGEVWSVAFSPDGRQVLSNDHDKTLKLWDAASGALLRTFEGHSSYVQSVAFSADERQVLSGSADGTLKLWDAASGALLRTFTGHFVSVRSVAFSPGGRQVLSGGSDGTARIWNVATGQLLVTSLATHAGEWLTITPEGFFAGSGKTLDQMLSLVQGLDVTTIGQVHQSLFNPDLVRAALAGDPDGELRDAAKIINLDRVVASGPAPKVLLVAPGRSTKDVVTVTARIADRGNGIGRIEWRVNGVTAAVTKPQGADPEYSVTQQVALDAGDNTIEVVAYNASNLLASLTARTTVKFTGPADRTKPKLHVLAVGIDAYASKDFSRLSFAGKDAKAFGTAMQQAAAGLYEEARVTYAIDGDATAAALDATVKRIGKDIHPRDTFILLVSAHGYSRNGRFYLIPQDYPDGLEALDTRAIGQDQLQGWIANHIKARKVLILLDTCESGALVAGHTTSRLNAPTAEAAIGRLHEATGRPILTAAASGRAAFEGYKQQHGIFTYALLDALRNGDQNGNGTIELSELVAHVQTKVAQIGVELDAPTRGVVAMSGVQDRGFVMVPNSSTGRQSARFGSRGEDFALVRRLQ